MIYLWSKRTGDSMTGRVKDTAAVTLVVVVVVLCPNDGSREGSITV